MPLTNAERQAKKRTACAQAGRKPYRGSTEFWPPEHALMCAVVEWIKAQRDEAGNSGDLSTILDVVRRHAAPR